MARQIYIKKSQIRRSPDRRPDVWNEAVSRLRLRRIISNKPNALTLELFRLLPAPV